ncbi:hypothetical protein [Tuanshanicoccus yangjingiae]
MKEKKEKRQTVSKEIQERELKLLKKQLIQHKEVFIRLKDK